MALHPPLPPRLNVVDGTGRLDARWTRQQQTNLAMCGANIEERGKGVYTSRAVHTCLAKATFVLSYFDVGLHLRYYGNLRFLF